MVTSKTSRALPDLIEHAAARSEPLRSHETPPPSGRSRQHEIHYRPECRIRRADLIAARPATALGDGEGVKKQLDIRNLRPGETFVLLNAFKDNHHGHGDPQHRCSGVHAGPPEGRPSTAGVDGANSPARQDRHPSCGWRLRRSPMRGHRLPIRKGEDSPPPTQDRRRQHHFHRRSRQDTTRPPPLHARQSQRRSASRAIPARLRQPPPSQRR